MKTLLKWLLVVGVAAAFAAANAVPMLLIVQQPLPKSYNTDFNVSIDSFLSIEMDEDGRVLPLLWSLTDPLFRAAVNDKILKNPPDHPTVEQALEAAKALKAEYVMIVKAWRKLAQVESEVTLYRNGKVVWSDKKATSILKDGSTDDESSAHSIARTWTIMLAQGVFKQYPGARRDTPNLDPGQKEPDIKIAPQVKVDNKGLAEQAAKLSKAGNRTALLLLLRDAVDAEPFDIERRRMLFDYLMAEGEVESAGIEATRAASLIPESSEFHVLSARAYMRVGEFDKAQVELNEALARDPESFETRMLSGDLALTKGDAGKAVEHYEIAISKKETPELIFKRGLAIGLNGDDAKAKAEIEKAYASKLTDLESAGLYQFAIQCLDARYASTIELVRIALQKSNASLKGGKNACAEALKPTTGFDAVLNLLKAPDKHRKSNDLRILASSLLAQSIGQIDEAIRTLNTNWLSDATLNLGEAAKQYTAAKKAFSAELQGTK